MGERRVHPPRRLIVLMGGGCLGSGRVMSVPVAVYNLCVMALFGSRGMEMLNWQRRQRQHAERRHYSDRSPEEPGRHHGSSLIGASRGSQDYRHPSLLNMVVVPTMYLRDAGPANRTLDETT